MLSLTRCDRKSKANPVDGNGFVVLFRLKPCESYKRREACFDHPRGEIEETCFQYCSADLNGRREQQHFTMQEAISSTMNEMMMMTMMQKLRGYLLPSRIQRQTKKQAQSLSEEE